jgi:urease accessory protein
LSSPSFAAKISLPPMKIHCARHPMIKKMSNTSKKTLLLPILATTVLLLLPRSAQAHVGFYQMTGGLMAGAEHPLGGADHLLAMVAIGLWAAQLGGRALWLLPSVFVTGMVGGGIAGAFGLPFPGSEQLIILSIFLLGAAILLKTRLQLLPSALLVALFAAAHGFAHGAEMPHSANIASYALGFSLVTAVLHASGVLLASGIQKYLAKGWLRYSGVAILLGGLAVVAHII